MKTFRNIFKTKVFNAIKKSKTNLIDSKTEKVKINKRVFLSITLISITICYYQYVQSYKKDYIEFKNFFTKNQIELYTEGLRTGKIILLLNIGLKCIKNKDHENIIFQIFKDENILTENFMDLIEFPFNGHIESPVILKIEQKILPLICKINPENIKNTDTISYENCSRMFRHEHYEIIFFYPIILKNNNNLYCLKVNFILIYLNL
jgi:hypothetical protein